jgi:hypothetical protein
VGGWWVFESNFQSAVLVSISERCPQGRVEWRVWGGRGRVV